MFLNHSCFYYNLFLFYIFHYLLIVLLSQHNNSYSPTKLYIPYNLQNFPKNKKKEQKHVLLTITYIFSIFIKLVVFSSALFGNPPVINIKSFLFKSIKLLAFSLASAIISSVVL